MLYQQRFSTAIHRTALVLLLVCLSSVLGMAGPKNRSVKAMGEVKPATSAAQDPAAVAQQKPSPTPPPTPRPNVSIAPGKAPQSEQGQKYGEPAFVGEPINLNVVNADIRDLLNYITEQYGVNFVIDSSVTAVPVTVNVQDVPWNIALNAILKANRLGVEVSGNILRVATTAVLATEAITNQQISDSHLSASPLVTEFIRLNYARAGGSLQATAGAAGSFAGGQASGATAGATIAVSGATSQGVGAAPSLPGGGDQGILPIIQRRLSKRGSVEADTRNNTLIITDVKDNIDAIRQLVVILDQPEPQVEIETRIVIAQHNFSRDLGAQLSAGVVNLGRGGLGNISTLPATSSSTGGSGGGTGASSGIQSGPNPLGVFGGLAGTSQPVGSLGAAAASTVIGLTTGLFGTAQISLLITAAESKGLAKTVATPRVTALNNRTAQIESGQQIPVQTSLGTTGATVVSTTFVSVPLRLSFTPQITDAGTVILRITIENNTLNGGIAVGGVPGIDTQRMQSEVMVPDGGTTVMGGVLADTESSTRQQTPGLGNLPVLGNLFKRKLTTRSNSEILFFVTPHIYRPDYQGRPTTGVVSTGNRTTTISQPVPLGNPQSNTPPPAQQPPAPQTAPATPQAPIIPPV